MDDVSQMLENEYRRLERAIEHRKKRLDEAIKRAGGRVEPRRYIVDIAFDATDATADPLGLLLQPVTGVIVIDTTSKCFYCEKIVGTLAAVGTVGGNSAKVSLPLDFAFCLFSWELRDTYSDRAWQSAPLPKNMLATGRNQGVILARPAPLPSGSAIEVTISPQMAQASLGASEVSAVTQYVVQIGLDGYEVLA